jgi:ATP-binding cassette subfamily F protein 3
MAPIAEVLEERVAPFTLPSPARALAPPLMQLDGATVGYDGRPVLRDLHLRLDVDDRIGLLGVNGAGKSTFAKMLAGALALQSGQIHKDSRIKVGWFHQHQIEALDPNDTPLDIIRRERPDDAESSRRARLAQFGLGFDKQETKVESLSGGERARLLLNLVTMAAPHLLILDEPTNHLDIDSRRALLEALNDYDGAVILITHDRSLIDLVADRLWLAADGHIKPFRGDMDDYARFVLDRAKVGIRAPSQALAQGLAQDLAPAQRSLRRRQKGLAGADL